MEREKDSSSPRHNSSEPRSLLKTLAYAFSGALFGLFLSRLETPQRQPVDSLSPKVEPQNKNDSEQIRSSLLSESPPSPQTAEQTCKCCHHKTPKWKIFVDWTMLLATTGAFIAAAIYAGLSRHMWHEMQNQTCVQREATINAERAWIGLEEPPQVEVSSLKQKTYTAQIHMNIKNFGKGPALNVFTDSRMALHGHVEETLAISCDLISPFVGLHPNRPVSSNEDITKHQWGQLIFPNQQLVTAISTAGESANVLGQEVFIVGCIVYKDQFEHPHWTKFSFSTGAYLTNVVRDAESFRHLYISSANNYTDDAEKKPSCPVTDP